jgi:hypothetical protein
MQTSKLNLGETFCHNCGKEINGKILCDECTDNTTFKNIIITKEAIKDYVIKKIKFEKHSNPYKPSSVIAKIDGNIVGTIEYNGINNYIVKFIINYQFLNLVDDLICHFTVSDIEQGKCYIINTLTKFLYKIFKS